MGGRWGGWEERRGKGNCIAFVFAVSSEVSTMFERQEKKPI